MSESEGRVSGEDFVRRFLIISVGSSASIHLLPKIASDYPELLFKNEVMVVETSDKMFYDAIDALTEVYKRNYAKMKGREEKDLREGQFPFSTFKNRLTENSVLLASEGGGATPERGLAFYEQRKDVVLDKIAEIVSKGEKRRISGIIVLGSAGKGTGTLITPALTRDLMGEPGVPTPLGFLTIPFRFDEQSVINAAKIKDYLSDVPMFLLDYERAVGAYMYLRGDVPRKKISVDQLWKIVVLSLSTVLSTLLETLNYSLEASPPLDWSDLVPILQRGYVGTVTFSLHSKRDDFEKRWRDDLATLLMLRTRSKPENASAVAIIKGVDISLEIYEKVPGFFRSFLDCTPRLYMLNRGPNFAMISLIHGMDPNDIEPDISPGRGILQRLFGL